MTINVKVQKKNTKVLSANVQYCTGVFTAVIMFINV